LPAVRAEITPLPVRGPEDKRRGGFEMLGWRIWGVWGKRKTGFLMEWIYWIEKVVGRGRTESLWDGMGIEVRGECDVVGGWGGQVDVGGGRGWRALAAVAGGGRLAWGEALGFS